MIQFNLLPDVKQQYIRAARMKRTAIVVSFLIASTSLFIFVMLFLSVYVFQRAHMKNLSNDIQTKTQELKDIPDLDKVLTIQNQLKELPGLHANKPVTSRLFVYLNKLTPAQVTIGNVSVDFAENTMSVAGTADSLSTINKFVDTLKFSTFTDKNDPNSESTKIFSDVVLSSFSRSDKEASYTITMKFDPAIFDSSKNIEVNVPSITSSRSETEKPTELFKALPEKKAGQ
jgi:Tfp pilus assembly protein PilN